MKIFKHLPPWQVVSVATFFRHEEQIKKKINQHRSWLSYNRLFPSHCMDKKTQGTGDWNKVPAGKQKLALFESRCVAPIEGHSYVEVGSH